MSWYRWLLCALMLAVADGAWLYLLLGLAGFVAGIGHSPVSLAVTCAALVVAVTATAVRDAAPAHWRRARLWRGTLAAATVWSLAAWAAPGVGVQAGWWWPFELLRGGYPAGDSAALLAVALLLAWLWRHGARRARRDAGAPRIARSFRSGLVVLAVVLALEAAGGIDLGTRGALLPFFLASLTGMALARAPAHGARSRAWLALAGATVAAVLAGGFVLGVVLVLALRGGAGALWALWLELATAAAETVRATLAALLGGGPAASLGFRPEPVAVPEWLVLLVLLAGAALTGWALHRLLRAPAPESFRIVLDLGEEQREPLEGEQDTALGRLVEALLPRGRRARTLAGASDRREASEIEGLYRRMLALARERGLAVSPAQTPFERAPMLRRTLPGLPVDELTRRYVAARYGAEPVPGARLRALRAALAAPDPRAAPR